MHQDIPYNIFICLQNLLEYLRADSLIDLIVTNQLPKISSIGPVNFLANFLQICVGDRTEISPQNLRDIFTTGSDTLKIAHPSNSKAACPRL